MKGRRSQPRLGQGEKRIPGWASFHPKLREKIDAEAAHFKCSRGFVVATAVAFALNFDEQADYKVEGGTVGKAKRQNRRQR